MEDLLEKHCKSIPRPDRSRLAYTLEDLKKCDLPDSFTFLDYGAGSGSIAIGILLAYPMSKGTLLDVADRADLSSEIAEAIKDRLEDVPWKMRDSLKARKFDLVVSTDVLEHIPNWKKALRTNLQHVAKGGFQYIQTPSNYKSPNWPSYKIYANKLLGVIGLNIPSEHIRHGLSCKSIVDYAYELGLEPIFASESYTCKGNVSCTFKPRTHCILKVSDEL